MNTKSKVIGAAVGALSLCGLSTAAFAFPQTPPSERAGLDLATPLPEGVYFVDIASIGGFGLAGGPAYPGMTASAFNYNVPVIAWSTPWSFNGIHLTLLGALPEAEVGTYTHAWTPRRPTTSTASIRRSWRRPSAITSATASRSAIPPASICR